NSKTFDDVWPLPTALRGRNPTKVYALHNPARQLNQTAQSNSLESVAEIRGLFIGELNHYAASALHGNAHDNAPSLFGDLQRSVTGPRFHGRHGFPSRLRASLGACAASIISHRFSTARPTRVCRIDGDTPRMQLVFTWPRSRC